MTKDIISTIIITIYSISVIVNDIPQVIHLIKVKDSTGVSAVAWVWYAVSTCLYISYIALNWDLKLFLACVAELVSETSIITLTIVYRPTSRWNIRNRN